VKKVRSSVDNQLIGTVVCARGQVAECDDDRAKVLVARGLAEYADGEAPGARRERPRPRRRRHRDRRPQGPAGGVETTAQKGK
jgi:hypothetical protein